MWRRWRQWRARLPAPTRHTAREGASSGPSPRRPPSRCVADARPRQPWFMMPRRQMLAMSMLLCAVGSQRGDSRTLGGSTVSLRRRVASDGLRDARWPAAEAAAAGRVRGGGPDWAQQNAYWPRTNPCAGIMDSKPWCSATSSVDTRVAALVAELTTDEKLCLFGGPDFATGFGVTITCGIERLGISSNQWWHEALHGVKGCPSGCKSKQTSFPAAIGMAVCFNRSLFHPVGAAIGSEAQALSGRFNGGTFFTPNVNTIHDPRWGRGQEAPGEDPTLTSEYVYVRGFQGGTKGVEFIQASACCKHFAVYNEEGTELAKDPHGREYFNVVVRDPRDFADTWFPAFEACAGRAGASGVMCSYYSVNGIGSCANKWLIDTKLRQDFGFRGYVTGDCRAVGDGSYKNVSRNDEFCIQTRNCVLKTRNCVLKTRSFFIKMMNFAGQRCSSSRRHRDGDVRSRN